MDSHRRIVIAFLLALPTIPAMIDGSSAATTACTVIGTSGNNVLVGTPGADKICGLGGNDVLRGLGGNDVLIGGLGNDTLYPGRGTNQAQGNAGVDTVRYDDLTSGTVQVDLLNGTTTRAVNDTLITVENAFGSLGNDRLIGNNLANRLVGQGGDDVIHGGLGDDVLLGGDGNDSFYPGRGTNLVQGAAGIDTVRYDDLTSGTVQVDLLNGTTTRAVNDTLITVENAFGSLGNDRLIGNELANRLVGQGGNDVIHGGSGDDHIVGADGDDRFYPGLGSNEIRGDSGVDTIRYDDLPTGYVWADLSLGTVTRAVTDAVSTVENVFGSPGNDRLVGNDLANRIVGQNGKDVIFGGLGDDALLGADGDDRIHPGLGNDVADGGPGTDTLSYQDVRSAVSVDLATGEAEDRYGYAVNSDSVPGYENLFGTWDWDLLQGTDGPNSINGAGGNDTIFPRLGRDSIFGGGYDDYGPEHHVGDTVDYSDVTSHGVQVDLANRRGPEGGSIVDIMHVVGTEQNDAIVGDPYSDYYGLIAGEGGDDHLTGRSDCGTILGGTGNDVLKPSLYYDAIDCPEEVGIQRVDGGDGTDTVSYTHATLKISVSMTHSWGGSATWWGKSHSLHSVEIVQATQWADNLHGGRGETSVTYYGRGGADSMNTTDGFGGDAMIASVPGSSCVGDALDSVEC